MATLAGNAAGAAGRVVKALVQGEAVRVPRELYNKRKAICATCPTRRGLRCANPPVGCGCVLELKTQLATEACPHGRW